MRGVFPAPLCNPRVVGKRYGPGLLRPARAVFEPQLGKPLFDSILQDHPAAALSAWPGEQADLDRWAPEDVQRTLLEFTARTVCEAIARWTRSADRLAVCGGGSQNRFLMERLAALSGLPVGPTDAGICPNPCCLLRP